MPLITLPIPAQGFEQIRDRIADILIEEIEHQRTLVSGFGHVSYFLERTIPISHTEMPAINVALATGSHDGKSAVTSSKIYNYHIDCYYKSAATYENDGDTLSAVNMQRLLGVCRAILENPVYRTLGFANPFIKRVFVSSISIADTNTNDTISVSMGRITFTVELPENMELGTGQVLDQYRTKINIGTSGVGYSYIGIEA